jgi:hypothetical protein
MIACLVMWAIAPGLAFCELKTLNDEDLSLVDAKAGGLFDATTNEGKSEAGTTADFLNGQTSLDGLKNANACSDLLDCAPSQNEFFSPAYQNPIRFSGPMPHCSSGGCR